MKTSILVATDLTSKSDEALRHGAALAQGRHTLAICHVLPDTRVVRPLFPQMNGDDALATLDTQQLAREALEQQLQRVGLEDVEVYFETGIPHVKLLERAKELKAKLLVIAGPKDWPQTTGTADGLIRDAKIPVLVARKLRRGPVMVAIDLGDPSMIALETGASEASNLKVDLVVVHVVDLANASGWLKDAGRDIGPGDTAGAQRHAVMKQADLDLEHLVARVAPSAKREILFGSTVDAICERSVELDASVVLVATQGSGGFGVAEDVARKAASSVLVMRHE